jgi:putative glutamine amidotransferase
LWQSLPDDIPGLRVHRSVLARKHVLIEPESFLARVMGVHGVRVNSLHRQGIRQVGAGLRVSARDADGVVQAIESVSTLERFVLGVQWHPEYLVNHAPHRRLFSMLVTAAKSWSPPSAALGSARS